MIEEKYYIVFLNQWSAQAFIEKILADHPKRNNFIAFQSKAAPNMWYKTEITKEEFETLTGFDWMIADDNFCGEDCKFYGCTYHKLITCFNPKNLKF